MGTTPNTTMAHAREIVRHVPTVPRPQATRQTAGGPRGGKFKSRREAGPLV